MNPSRRRFLTHSCALGAAATPLFSSLLSLGAASSAAAQAPTDDYRALVCILLAGGNDSFNMLVPYDQDQYSAYRAIRSDLALPRPSLLPLAGSTTSGRRYGVHPGMPELEQLYAAGELAFIANVGTLVEPVDASSVESGGRLPLGLFSHSDQIAQWQTAVADRRIASGWGGRTADLLSSLNQSRDISMNISLSGTNLFQSGNSVVEYAIEAEGDGAPGIEGYNGEEPFSMLQTAAIDSMLSNNYANLFRRAYAERLRSAIDSQAIFTQALATTPPLATDFSSNELSAAMRQIARVIGARDQLGMRRQTFFIEFGGWDHHDEVLNNQAQMLPVVAKALAEFRSGMIELGVHNQVTTFTTSDFGRTLTSNGKGSDHGWGGHQIIMGGAVQGGQIYGSYPELSNTNPLALERGVYIPTLSVDSYFAELALWFGVQPSELDAVLPNVRRFYSPESGSAPIGFMA